MWQWRESWAGLNLFGMDIDLRLSEEQRQFQWHKLSLLQEMRSPQLASYIPRRVKVNITQAEMFQIEERRTELPGISVELEPVRQIFKDPDGSAFGTHFLGYINATQCAGGYSTNTDCRKSG